MLNKPEKSKQKIKKVFKFGGSCLRDSSSFRQAIRLIKAEQPERVAVVVSAVQGVTDLLLDAYHKALGQDKNYKGTIQYVKQKHLTLAAELLSLKRFGKASELFSQIFSQLDRLLQGITLVGDSTPGLKARILSSGERLSAWLLGLTMEEAGLTSRVYETDRIGLIVDQPGEGVSVNLKKFDKNFASVSEEIAGGSFIPVFTGYFGCTENGQVALFGRNGSDYSAAIIARGLRAEILITFKDVSGFLSADPEIVPQATTIPYLDRKEAAELAYFGSRVLHPKTLEPVSDRRLILEIRSFQRPEKPGTVIQEKTAKNTSMIKSFALNQNISILRIEGPGVGHKPGIIGLIGSRLAEKNINILTVLTSQTCINLILDKSAAELACRVIKELNETSIKNLSVEHDLALIACVGFGLRETPGVAGKIFSVMSREKINLEFFSSGASEVAIYLIVKKDEAVKAVKALHREYFTSTRETEKNKPEYTELNC
ncbi:MAG: aspartate kinase [Candidatus Aminicenantes bacterium]|nr:aspartate kinase [Candidatus Aminicenantes bacterium]